MTALEIIQRCHELRNPLWLSRDGLMITASQAPPDDLADEISRQKDEVRYHLATQERERIAVWETFPPMSVTNPAMCFRLI